jgi:hypothetical protein
MDRVVHGGDLALMGPRPVEVVERIVALGWRGVVGNTDELLWRPEEHERQLQRVPYDLAAEETAMRTAGHPDAERLDAMRRRGRFVAPVQRARRAR